MNLGAISKPNPVRCRALSKEFMDKLKKKGIYGPLVERVRADKDLDLEFRGNYINIYYQGHSILKLYQSGGIDISDVFTRDIADMLRSLKTPEEVAKYLELLPKIKDNVTYRDESKRSSKSRELEFEQLLIRANNLESRNNSEYIILDRQYVVINKGKKDRWDLIALRWPLDKRGTRYQEGYLSIIEVKYALNPDIQDIKDQVEGYGCYLEANLPNICKESKRVLEQKLDLGLLAKTDGQIERLRKLPIVPEIQETEIIIYLIDYNHNSDLKRRAIGAGTPNFGGKVRIALGGLALWQANLTDFVASD